jgi:hypothetical protein
MREAQWILKLLEEVTAEIESSPTIGIFLQFPEWAQIQSCIVDALKPYPEHELRSTSTTVAPGPLNLAPLTWLGNPRILM